MPNLTDSDLRDPSPPVPGAAERAAVATRAHQLGRKRRMMQGAGALGMVAAVAVGVAALTAGGTSGSRTSRIEAAADTTEAVVTTVPAPVTTVPAPVATVPAPTVSEPAAAEIPTVDTAPAPVEPSTFSVSGTVGNIPADVTVTLTLSGPGGTFTAVTSGAGDYSMSGVPAGEYQAMFESVDSTGTATSVAKLGAVTISGDSTFSFNLQ